MPATVDAIKFDLNTNLPEAVSLGGLTQVIIRNEDGTPVAVVQCLGDSAAMQVSCVGQEDFNDVLKSLDIGTITIGQRT